MKTLFQFYLVINLGILTSFAYSSEAVDCSALPFEEQQSCADNKARNSSSSMTLAIPLDTPPSALPVPPSDINAPRPEVPAYEVPAGAPAESIGSPAAAPPSSMPSGMPSSIPASGGPSGMPSHVPSHAGPPK